MKASRTNPPSMRYLFFCAVVSMAGILYGFDTAVISGALNPLTEYFGLAERPAMLGWTVSSVLLGSVLGASISGVADLVGRRSVLIFAGLLFSLSAIGSSLTSSLSFFILARFIGGIGVGMAAMTAPLYISEISPPERRGAMVSLYQFAITVGVLVAYLTNDLFRKMAGTYDGSHGETLTAWFYGDVWRVMLGSEVVPALAFTICILFVPASPRYLVLKGNISRARAVLRLLLPLDKAENTLTEIIHSLEAEKTRVVRLFAKGHQKAVFIALFLAIVSQFSGIDIILHYGPVILERGGLSFAESLNGQILFGVVLVVFTTFAIWKVDQYGRRKLLFIGNLGIFFSLLAIGVCFWSESASSGLLLFFISFFIACFAFSMGPIPWIIMAEIFPTPIRGRAMALATLTLFGANWLIAQLFPILAQWLGEHGTFWLLAVLTLPTFYFVIKVLPETKGQRLEEISVN